MYECILSQEVATEPRWKALVWAQHWLRLGQTVSTLQNTDHHVFWKPFETSTQKIKTGWCQLHQMIDCMRTTKWLTEYVKCQPDIIEGARHSYWERDWMSEWVWMKRSSSSTRVESCTIEQKLCRRTWRIPTTGNPSMGLSPLNCPPLVVAPS